MADTEARGSEVAATNEPRMTGPGKSFPKKSKPETQNFTQIAEEFKAGTRGLKGEVKLAKKQAVTQMQQDER